MHNRVNARDTSKEKKKLYTEKPTKFPINFYQFKPFIISKSSQSQYKSMSTRQGTKSFIVSTFPSNIQFHKDRWQQHEKGTQAKELEYFCCFLRWNVRTSLAVTQVNIPGCCFCNICYYSLSITENQMKFYFFGSKNRE